MIEKCYHEKVINEILELIKNNIYIYYNFNDCFLEIKKYCEGKNDNKYNELDYNTLVFFVEETLAELINCCHLYDLRTLE